MYEIPFRTLKSFWDSTEKHTHFNLHLLNFSAIASLDMPDAAYFAIYGTLAVIGIVAAVLIGKEPVKDIDLYKTAGVTPAPVATEPVQALT